MKLPQNLFKNRPAAFSSELVETLLTTAHVRVERIVSQGEASAEDFWYDQSQHEWVALLQGAARLRFERDNQSVDLKPGDVVNIPAHEKHRVDWTTPDEPTIWLAIHYD